MNIAIFGGSFDPPHNGHNAIVKTALLVLDIDKLIIVPTFLNPFKSKFSTDPKKRLVWCETLWGNLKKVEISKFEIEQNRAVPSLESVLHFKKIYNPSMIYLIIGADQLANLEKWYKFNILNTLVKFVVASRDDIYVPPNLQKLDLNVKISSTKVRDELDFSNVPELIRRDVIKFYEEKQMQDRINRITKLLDEKKAENIEVVDMSGLEYLAKFVIIATTLTGRHAYALLDDLKTELKPNGEEFLGVESSDDWTVIDLGDIMIHLMSEAYRAKYNIEEFLKTLKK